MTRTGRTKAQENVYFPQLLLISAVRLDQDWPEDWCGLCFPVTEHKVTLKGSASFQGRPLHYLKPCRPNPCHGLFSHPVHSAHCLLIWNFLPLFPELLQAFTQFLSHTIYSH